jgi:hypothetical protein
VPYLLALFEGHGTFWQGSFHMKAKESKSLLTADYYGFLENIYFENLFTDMKLYNGKAM